MLAVYMFAWMQTYRMKKPFEVYFETLKFIYAELSFSASPLYQVDNSFENYFKLNCFVKILEFKYLTVLERFLIT